MPAAQPEAPSSAHARDHARPIRVLVAEDVAVNRELIRLILEPKGFEVELACDGLEAVGMAAARPYDIIFMDMQMPGLDGVGATQAIRGMGGLRERLPIIALSANVVPDQVRQCLKAGMTAHISKPFTSESLCGAIDRWCGGAEQGPANPVLQSFIAQAGWDSVRSLLHMMLAQITAFEQCDGTDATRLGRQAHALRGAAGVLGFADLAMACGAVETACQNPDPALSVISLGRKAAETARRQIDRELAQAA